MKRLVPLPLLLFPALAHAQSNSDGLSLAEARSLSPEALARRVLGASGVLVKEANIEGQNSRFADPRRLARVIFASMPRAGGFPGVCAADIYAVGFAPPGDGENIFDSPGPAKVATLSSETVFRLVDAGPVPASGWSEEYGRKLKTACARLRPVLRSSPVGGLNYFSSSFEGQPDQGGHVASFVGQVLNTLIGQGNHLICRARRPEMCRARAEAFIALSFSGANVTRCEKSAEHWCASMSYVGGLSSTVLNVEIARPDDLSKAPIIYSADVDDIQAVE